MLIVEDEVLLAKSIRILIACDGRFEVVGIADDLASALALAETAQPDLALVDIQLARGASGLEVAPALRQLGIACLFMTGNPPDAPRPDLAYGCLSKPFSDAALFQGLQLLKRIEEGATADLIGLPTELTLY